MIWIIPYMAVMSAWAGGSLWPSYYLKGFWTNLPEILFSLGFSIPLWLLIGPWSLVAVIWSYAWMQSGHANALDWGRNANPDRENTLTPVVDYIARLFGIDDFGRGYSFVFMSVKGFLMTLPVGGTGALFWPLGYDAGVWLGRNFINDEHAHTVTELLAGMGAGISIYIAWMVINA